MSVEKLDFAENRVREDDACSPLADEPVTGYYIDGGAIQGIWVHSCGEDGETGEYDETCSKCPTTEVRRTLLPPS